MRINKVLLKIERKSIQIYKFVSRRLFNERFTVFLKHLGVNVIGKPGFISDDVWIDEVAPELITIKNRAIISKGVTLLVHDYSANPLLKNGEYLFGRGGIVTPYRNSRWSFYRR